MKLKTVQIKNFKSINDSDQFTIDQITCLVGKNESGKTAVLQALSKLKPVVNTGANFEEMDFPRMSYADYDEENRPKDILFTEWELEDEDVVAIEARLGNSTILSRNVSLQKGYENELLWSIKIDMATIVENFKEAANLHTEEKLELSASKTTSDLIAQLKKITGPSERQTSLLNSLKKAFPEGHATAAAHSVLNERLPTFLYFGNYEAMKGEVSVEKLIRDIEADNLKMPDRIFIALLDMAGTNVTEIKNITRSEALIAKLEAVSNRLSKEIFKYWSQNKHLAIQFRYDPARPNDPAPFNSGSVFRTRIYNSRHGVTVSFDERSTGFVWFFSFLVWFSQVKRNYGKNLIILLDEPGLNLHAKAQGDLLRYIKEQLLDHQVIYSTHSPFMIDPNNLMSVRTVEDLIIDDEVLGTKIGDDVLSTDKDTIFPLQAALGFDVSQTLFVGEHVLLVEGPSDLLYLQWASNILRTRKRVSLDKRWVITPAGSIDKISSFISLFGGNKIHVATLTDYSHGEKKKVQTLKEHRLLKEGSVFTLNEYAGQDEADIEDILGRTLYMDLINKCYNLPSKLSMPKIKDAQSSIRVVKEVESLFRIMPSNIDEFDHYTPAAYLVNNSLTLDKSLPNIEEALDRFEKIFIDVNKKLN